MSKRYDELDSLRGLAAATVVFCHLLPLGNFWLMNKLDKTPFHLLWAGHEAVILFFILSGFVLSLPYYNNDFKKPIYKNYLIRRICRIYLPYAVSVIIAIVCMKSFYSIDFFKLGGWFDKPISSDLVLNHAVLITEFDSYRFNMVVWSLVHEMRISLIFPLLMFLVLKFSWKRNLILSVSGSIFFYVLYVAFLKVFNYDATKLQGSYLYTIHYFGFFVAGALLAKNREHLNLIYAKMGRSLKITLLVAGVLAYTYNWWFLNDLSIVHLLIVNDWIIAVGAAIFILFFVNSKAISSLVLKRPIRFVGKISYSLYLYHLIVALSVANYFHGKLPMEVITGISIALTFIVATVMYYLIENPSINLGKIMTQPKKSKHLGAEKLSRIA
ncbi:acyltransferase family protein [Paenibacillus sp. GCM10023248]|uniref:acyltransferase family protein n=1 Tax=unclassified Paenibacillus TaxID=185978 RepID=UPI0023782379|nr:acyltransferase [Paenibacillus sp. MAHUQ-63]MDD9266036.1 acyltransferase [Paenibacillus sp. MAHUQ-63]